MTHREFDVLVALCRPIVGDAPFTEPASIRRIAEELVVSEAAVKQHILHLYDKFELNDEHENRRVRLANAALECGVVTAADLGGEPGIRTRGSRPGLIDLGAAREEARIGEWDGAYGGFSAVDIDTLEPADLELLGHAAFWSEHPDASIAARQRAHAAYLVRGDPAGASRVALDLSLNHISRLRLAVAAGWFETARRLLGPIPEGREHAQLAAVAALFAIATGGFDTALVETERGLDLGRRHGDRDSVALCLTYRGYALVHLGRGSEGLALLDEAMALAMSGQVGTFATDQAFCRTLGACVERWDFRRAAEWTDALLAGGGPRTIGTGGDCLTHRVAVDIVRGEWRRGAAAAETACLETEGFDLNHVATALAGLGEIHLRRGDLELADAAFRRAHTLGGSVAGGMARLLFERGDVVEAANMIDAALRDATSSPLFRAGLLPVAVDIALARDDVERARAASGELAATADATATEALRAAAAHAVGSVALADGDAMVAETAFRASYRAWQDVGAPYEAAHARVGLGRAMLLGGSPGSARLEFDAAGAVFERLGAARDVERVARLANPGRDPSLAART